MSDNYYRSTISTGTMSISFFRYKDVFQIYPASSSNLQQQGKPIVIEYNDAYRLKNGKDEFVDQLGQGYGHLELLQELVALLNIITNCPCWIPRKESSIRPGVQEKIERFHDTSDIPKISFDETRILTRQNGSSDFLEIQKQSVEFLDNYFMMDVDYRERINTSLFLYQKMRRIITESASMGLVGLVSSIENLVQLEGKRNGFKVERCGECSSEKYKLTRRFRDFMETYSEENFVKEHNIRQLYRKDPRFAEQNARKLITSFYNKRSSIAHAGDILEMDRTLSTFSMKDVMLFNEVETLTRVAIFSYILGYESGSGIYAVSDEQRFDDMISAYSWAAPLWDRETKSMDTEAVESFKAAATQNERILLQFFLAVWQGRGTDFDISEAAVALDRQDRHVVVEWLLNPFWPN